MANLYEAVFTSDIDPMQFDPYVVQLQVRYQNEHFKQRIVNVCKEKEIVIQYSKVDPILQVAFQKLFKKTLCRSRAVTLWLLVSSIFSSY